MPSVATIRCTRCDGTGKFSFNLVRGTVCFKCDGKGIEIVDIKKEEKRQLAAKKRLEEAIHQRAIMSKLYLEAAAEMNTLLGPFDIDTEIGLDKLNLACGAKFGKAIHTIRDERFMQTKATSKLSAPLPDGRNPRRIAQG